MSRRSAFAAGSALWYVDVETLEIVRLDSANKGRKAIDENNNDYPTVMPVAVGGYFWVFWTAVRDYGYKVQGRPTRRGCRAPDAINDATKKRIWAAAIKARREVDSEVMQVRGHRDA